MLEKCIHCGECRTACPVFEETRQERFTARGRIGLLEALLEGEIEPSEKVYGTLDKCLLCLACCENCGGGVLTEEIVRKSRAEWVANSGLKPIKKLVQAGLTGGDETISRARKLQQLLFRKVPAESGLRRRFPLPLVDKEQLVPELAETSFRNSFKPSPQSPKGPESVILFTGCLANYATTPVAEATVKVLEKLGIGVEVPPGQGCCGAPLEIAGDTRAAREQAEVNVSALTKLGSHPVIVPCPTCGLTIRQRYFNLLGDDPVFERKARSLAERTLEITEYLVGRVGLDRLKPLIAAPLQERVTYHDPCHLARGLGVRDQPRELLKVIAPEGFVEMEEADRCCGLAGTFHLTNRPISKKIQARKTARVRESGAGVVATGCSACVIQLRDGAHRAGLKVRARHVIELLAETIGE